MPYEEVNGFTGLYDQQALVNENAITYIQTENAAATTLEIHPRVHEMTQAQVDEMIGACAQTLNKIDFLELLIRGLDENYQDMLKHTE